MKKISIISALLLTIYVFSAVPAFALTLTEATLNANCDYYEVTVKGITWTTFEADFALDLVIVSPDGTSTVSGTFHVPFDATTVPMSFNTTYRGYWETALCGTATVSGSVTLYPAETQYDPLVGELAPVTVVCECGPCGCEGKVTQLTLQYNGSEGATIEVFEKGKKKSENPPVFSGFVGPGEQFSFVGTDKNGTLGTEITITVNGVENTKIHTSCSQPIGPGLVSGDFLVIAGASLKFGSLCPVTMPPEDPPGDECDCEGKVTNLTLQYNGSSASTVEVFEKEKKKSENLPVFSGLVGPGEQFSFVGTDKNGTFGTEITITVNGVENAKIHTSCSQPIGPGLVSGDFLVIAGASLKGGALCPVDMNSGKASYEEEDDCGCRGKGKKKGKDCDKGSGKIALTAPGEFSLVQNYPNPFNPTTTIEFTLPSESHVTLTIYNTVGRKVATLVDRHYSAGRHAIEWNAREYSSGVYFYRLNSGENSAVRKLILMK